jgi:hypothetical protein
VINLAMRGIEADFGNDNADSVRVDQANRIQTL